MTTSETSQLNTPKPQAAATEESPKETKGPQGPGARLSAARAAKNMAVSEVASLLRLDTSVIRALEADDVDQLPSPTFTKGYLRGYGRLVGVDGELLVSEYDALAGPAPEALAVSTSIEAKESGAGRWLWVLLAFLLIVAVAWYWSKPGEEPVSTDSLRSVAPETIQPAEPVSQTAAPQFTAAASEQETADEVIEQLLRGLKDDAVAPAPETAQPVVAEAIAEEAQVTEGAEPAQEPEEATATESAPETSELDAEEIAAEPAAEETLAPGMVELTLTGLRESWVSIRDGREQRIYRNLLKAGDTKVVQGQAPLLIHFGNAKGVKMLVNGQQYDHSAWHKSNNTARFVLNPAQ